MSRAILSMIVILALTLSSVSAQVLPSHEPITADNLDSMEQLGRFPHRGANFIAWSPDGQLAVSGSAGVRLYDMRVLETQPQRLSRARTDGGMVFSPDGTLLVSGSSDGTVRLWGVRRTGS